MKFCIYGKRFEPDYASHVEQLFQTLIRRGVKISVYDQFYSFLKTNFSVPENIETYSSFEEVKDASFMLSVGGDGTVLDTVSIIRDSKVPILGVNTGRLGFLSHVDVEQIEEAVEALINGEFTLDKRSLIEVRSEQQSFGEFPFALNDVTLINNERSSMITVHAYVNDQYMSTYWSDGLIIATPTGSTAYSLSCGGPIVTPDSNNIIITPIAPHNLNVRPLILSNTNKVSIRPEGRSSEFQLTVDSKTYIVHPETIIDLTRASFEINLVKLENQNFFNTIRKKMGWGMDKRN
jgi:NAD+ kinase